MAENLEIKEVWVDGHRYVVCHNPEEEVRDREQQEEIILRARKDLEKKGRSPNDFEELATRHHEESTRQTLLTSCVQS